jgi:hypothetical protein
MVIRIKSEDGLDPVMPRQGQDYQKKAEGGEKRFDPEETAERAFHENLISLV